MLGSLESIQVASACCAGGFLRFAACHESSDPTKFLTLSFPLKELGAGGQESGELLSTP
jgi:hypothetical protein